MRRMPPFTLRQKLIAASVLCIILPAVMTFTVSSASTKGIVIDQAIKNENKTMEVINQYISNLLRNMIYISNYIQFDADLTQLLKLTAEGELDQSEEVFAQSKVTDKLVNLTYHSERTFVTILTPNRKYYTNYRLNEFNPTIFFDEPWFEDLDQMKTFDIYWIGAHSTYLENERKNNPQMLTIARSLKTPAGFHYANVIVSIYENQINSMFQNEDLLKETMLVDGDGHIISHRNPELIGTMFPYSSMLALQNLKQDDPPIIGIEGNDYLLLEHPLSIGDWRLVNLISYKGVTAKINTIYQWNITVQIGLFCLFLIILISLIRQFTKPIVQLDKVAGEVERGNLSVRSHIRGHDEIGKLGKSFDHMIDQVVLMIDRITMEQSLKRKAELEMLQAQINPHFLFNVLNSIRLRVLMNGDEDNANIIASLSSLLRMTINRNNEFILLHDEIKIVKDYIDLLNFRHKEKVDLVVDAASDSLLVEVPRFFIQPLIENAYIHGFHQRGGTIQIRSWLEEGELSVVVQDTGTGMSREQLARLQSSLNEDQKPLDADKGTGVGFGRELGKELGRGSPGETDGQSGGESGDESRRETGGASSSGGRNHLSGIGLSNIYSRLKLIYGANCTMMVDSELGKGTSITFKIKQEGG